MNEELINKLMDFVEESCKSKKNINGYGIWSHHIRPMITIAGNLAGKYKADIEIVVIASILHDIAGILFEDKIKEHHLYGAIEAEKILKEYNYPEDRIEKIKLCIRNHRGSVNNKKESVEEICVADADAIAHIEGFYSMFYLAYKEKELNIDEGKSWVRAKLERDWNKMSKKSRGAYKEKYNLLMELLN